MLGSGQYTLTSQPELDDESSKICVLVKLTDSSVRAIDEFLKSKNNGAKKPTITFQKDKGEIVLPIDSSASRSQPAASSAAESTYQLKKFLFTLSSIKESYKDTSASSECICFNDSKFKTVAPIEQKLNVLANDEVFLATKEKVNSGVEEEKKNSTKEIKPSGLIGNRNGPKATLAQPNINRIKHPTVMPPNSNIKTTPESANKPRNPVLDRPIRERLVHMLAVRPFTRAEILLRLFKDTPNLANERDRETVDQVLQSVAILNAKTGAYELKYETMLNEVNDEWQFYSQTEKSYVKRAINKIKQGPPPSSQPTTSSQEPTAPLKATGSSSIGVGGQKSTSAFMSLKHQSQTTNNNNRSNLASQFESAVESLDTSNSSVSGRPSWSSNNKISPTSKQQQQKISARPSGASAAAADQSIADLSISSSSNDSLSLSFNTSLPSLSLSMSSSKTRPAEKENHNHSSHQNDGDLSNSTPNPNKKAKFSSSTTSSSAAASYHHSNSSNRQSEIEAIELNECAKRYKKIQNDQQREQYLNDFNKYHDQYTELYSYLENLSKRFTSYQQEMAQKDENSDEYQEMKRRVQREYLALQANKEYIQKRERYWLLHVRLKHIEDQIRDWTMNDSANLSE